jgi:long-chain acyl-CoA synthetase
MAIDVMTLDESAKVDADAKLARAWPVMSLEDAHSIMTRPGSPFEIVEMNIRGVNTRTWKNGIPTLREVFLAGRAHGDKTFLIYENDRVSYEAFTRATLALAHELLERGLQKGDRVAIAMRNLPEFAVSFFAATIVGGVATPLNAWWTAPELHYGLIDSGARFAIMDIERLTRVNEQLAGCAGLERIYVSRSGGGALNDSRALRLESLIGSPNTWSALPDRPIPNVSLHPEDDASIFYTSGTTGLPRGALGTHRNATSNIMAVAFASSRTFVRRGETPPDANPTGLRRCTLLTIPLFHTTACLTTLVSALFAGGKLVLMRRWDAELALQLIEREQVTVVSGVPTIAWQLIEHPSREQYDLSSLENVFWGGAPASPELVRLVKEAFPRAQPGAGWGMTETSAATTNHMAEDYLNRPESCGPPVPVCELKITGPDGETLPPEHVGDLWAKGPNVVKGYWNDPKATAAVFVDGWVRTGDVAKLDAEGFCYILDRAKDIVIRGGENIYCVELENALYEHPAVVDAAIVPIPHKTLGEEPGAVVTLKRDAQATEAELIAFVGRKLASFKVPTRILFWPEPLPRNANGKILKRELKKMFDAA